jgi:hypothetical protein
MVAKESFGGGKGGVRDQHFVIEETRLLIRKLPNCEEDFLFLEHRIYTKWRQTPFVGYPFKSACAGSARPARVALVKDGIATTSTSLTKPYSDLIRLS